MNEFMYSHKLYIDDICDVENFKFNDEDKKKTNFTYYAYRIYESYIIKVIEKN